MLSWVLLLICGWFAATISGAAGFGGALLLLPVLALVVGDKSAVPILTVAQLLGNLSRAGFGWREIRWRPALLFSIGAVPASVLGARVFAASSSTMALRFVGVLPLVVVASRRTRFAMRTSERLLAPLGVGIGFISAVAGSAGPLAAAVFLGLQLPARAYVSSEAVTAVLMHLTKSVVYGRYSAMNGVDVLKGVLLGCSLVAGSWSGRKVVDKLAADGFTLLVETLLVVSGVVLILAGR